MNSKSCFPRLQHDKLLKTRCNLSFKPSSFLLLSLNISLVRLEHFLSTYVIVKILMINYVKKKGFVKQSSRVEYQTINNKKLNVFAFHYYNGNSLPTGFPLAVEYITPRPLYNVFLLKGNKILQHNLLYPSYFRNHNNIMIKWQGKLLPQILSLDTPICFLLLPLVHGAAFYTHPFYSP